jgi:hypothetical protein
MTSGIDGNAYVRVVREEPGKPELLFCGTETGLFVSFNGGGKWERYRSNLPLTPIHDLVFKDGDLIVGTHGRGFWVLDDLSPLRSPIADSSKPAVYAPRDTYKLNWGSAGSSRVVGQNPPNGFILSYHLPAKAESVSIELSDGAGTVLSTTTGPTDAGFNRTTLGLPRFPAYRTLPGLILWGAGAQTIPAPPGEYTVKITSGSWSETRKVRLVRDPRSEATDADLKAQFDLAIKIRDRVTELHEGLAKIRDAKKKIAEAKQKDASLGAAADAFTEKLSAVEEEIYQVKNQSGQDPLNYPIRLNNRMAALLPIVLGGDFGPTQSQLDVFAGLSREADAVKGKWESLWAKELVEFNAELKKKSIEPVVPEAAGLTQAGGGRRRGGEGEGS